MIDLLGIVSIFFLFLITLSVALLWPGISRILFVALILRILLLFFGNYIIPLPGSTSDAVQFENKAWEIAQGGFFSLLSNFKFDPFIVFSWFHAIPYSIFGRSLLMGQSISLLFGLGVIFCGRISAFGSGAFGVGMATGFGAGGFARGGAGGGGGGGFFDFAAFCSFFTCIKWL